MDCRETRTLLNAFHDGELPAGDRARVEEHLRGCPECAALLGDLARADRAAGVPDPGPAYWDRFNARVMDRVAREADGPGVRVLRPKGGWMREQLRYLVPAAAAAALVLVIVHYGEMRPGVPAPAAPPAVSKPEAPEPRVANETGGGAGPRRLPPQVLTGERSAAVTRQERDRLADRSAPAETEEAFREHATAPPPPVVPSPAPLMPFQGAPDGQRWTGAGAGGIAKGSSASESMMEKDQAGESPPSMSPRKTRLEAGASSLAPASSHVASPCELARTLAEQGRIRDADAAQRTCLAGDLDAPSREKGLVFLAELLDRQGRFSDADVVIAEVEKQYPRSRPLDLYRERRPMVQKRPKAVPVTR